jgi:anti-repressor protein
MNELNKTTVLIKIQEKEGKQVVSARDLHSYLEVETRFNDWVSRMLEYGFEEGQDFMVLKNEYGQNAPNPLFEKKEYALTLDCAKEIAMIQRSEKGKQARLYFIECEKKLIESKPKLPTTYLEALEKLIETEKKRIEAEATVAILTHVNKTYTVTEIAKEIGLKSAIELNKILQDMKIQYKVNDTWVLYSKYANLGYFDIKQEVLDNGRVIYHRRVTQTGREFILKIIK